MKPTCFVLLTLGCITSASAQLKDIVKESFSAPTKSWWMEAGDSMTIKIAEGKYKMQLVYKPGGMTFSAVAATDFSNDFILEATFRQIGGENNKGIGIFWGHDSKTARENNFCFASTGYVRSWTSDETKESLRQWVTAAVKPIGQDNKLRVEKTGTKLKYILNGATVLDRDNFITFGNKIGVVLYGNMEVWMDDFYYAEKRKPDPIITVPKGAELPIFFEDQFNDNANEWTIGKAAQYEATVSNGSYNINYLKETGGFYFPKLVGFNPNFDYEIQAEIIQTTSIDDDGFGILWGYDDPNNTLGFIACADGNVRLYQTANNETTDLLPWKKLNHSKPNGTPNSFSVIQRNKQWYFLLNGQAIYTCPARKLFGQSIGVEVNGRAQIAVNKIAVKQTKEPINLVPNLPPNLTKEPLTKINSSGEDIAPRLSPDGKTLYIVRKGHPQNLGEKDDVWVSSLQADGTWGDMKNVGPPLNNAGHNMVVSVAPDNNSIMLMNTYKPDGSQLGAGISQSVRNATGWSIPVNQKIDDYYNDNDYSEMWLAASQKVLLFSIERKDTHGERDMYVSFLKEDGTWTAPKNMGSDINTFADEGGPFLASDDKTFYFSSAGWPGYGSKDIFMTKRLDDTWTKWSKPQNLGVPINSNLWEGYYTMSAAGDYAIVAASHSSTRSDLYSVRLPVSAKPEAVIIVRGKVLNAKTNEPIGAEISYELLSKAGEVGIARSNPSTGEYKIVFNYGSSYGFHAKAEGYISVNENMELALTGEYQEVEKNLFLVPLTVGETIMLNNVFFFQGKPELKPESYAELDRLAVIMQENPNLVIELAGHTDNAGDKKLNIELSQKRVIAVTNYLLSKGINRQRMTGQGYGGTKPIVPNTSDSNRQKNRRVEFKIVKN